MQLFTNERTKQLIKVIIYVINIITIVKLYLKLHQKLTTSMSVYYCENYNYENITEIIKYSIEIFSTIVLLCYYVIFSFNIDMVHDIIEAYIVVSLYILLELNFNYIFTIGIIVGLQLFIRS